MSLKGVYSSNSAPEKQCYGKNIDRINQKAVSVVCACVRVCRVKDSNYYPSYLNQTKLYQQQQQNEKRLLDKVRPIVTYGVLSCYFVLHLNRP